MDSSKIREKLVKYIHKHQHDKLESLVHKYLATNLDDFQIFFCVHLFNNDKFETTLLYYLFAIDNYNQAKYVLNHGFNVYRGYDMYLMMKILNKCKDSIKYLKLLIDHNFDVNHKCHMDQSTLLHMACNAYNVEAVKYLLLNGAVAFHYKNDVGFVGVNMNSTLSFGGEIDGMTPLSLVSEMLNDCACKIAELLVVSIPDLNQLVTNSSSNTNNNGFNYDIDELATVAFRKNCHSVLDKLRHMNFNFILYKERFSKRNKAKIEWVNDKNISYFEQNKRVNSLKNLCRLRIRSYIGTLDASNQLYKPRNCNNIEDCTNIVKEKQFLLKVINLPLPDNLINYLNYGIKFN